MNQIDASPTGLSSETIVSGLKSLFDNRVYYKTFCDGRIDTIISELVTTMCPPGYELDEFRERLVAEFESGHEESQVIVIECSTRTEAWQVRILRNEYSVLATCAFVSELQPAQDSELQNLTDREMEILSLLVGGRSNKEAAAVLYLSPRTVEKHRANIHAKTQTNSLAVLAQMWVAAGHDRQVA